jgi:hypothetical protein
MALAAHGRRDAARPALDWLAQLQAADGAVGVDATHATPNWPTGWAVLVWRLAAASAHDYDESVRRGLRWLVEAKGLAREPDPLMGHDVTIQAWPWVDGTSSWIEPTAIAVLALAALAALATADSVEEPRLRDGVRLLCDRVLPAGGWNYGNRIVLGAVLRPQVQPTGLALAALAASNKVAALSKTGENLVDRKTLGPSLDYLDLSLRGRCTPASTCFALIGLAAHGRRPAAADAMLESTFRSVCARGGSPYHLALVAHAALGAQCPWWNAAAAATVAQGGAHE